jgi:membrane fusion protein (multidrug efflux system)
MASKALYTVVAVGGIAAASGAAWWFQHKPASGAGEPQAAAAPAAPGASGAAQGGRAPVVEAAPVQQVRLADDAQAVGSLRSRQSVVVRPEVSGRVTKINFRDGERIRRGQLLVQLDDQLPQAQVQQAEAELSIARANHKRNQELLAQNFISAQRVDESAANLQVAEAKLALARATSQRLKITAPFDGVAGIRSINVGDYLKDGQDIVNLEDLAAIYVDFRLPERFQTKVRRGLVATVQLDALPGRSYQAVVQAIDPAVDANGRSLGIRGCIDNRKLELRPGMFARVNTVFAVRDSALVVPEEAIVPQGGRTVVYRLAKGADAESRIAQRVEVKTGLRQPGKVEVVEGLNPGDVVVTAGQQRIQKDGMTVRVLDIGTRGGPAPAPAPAQRAAQAAPAAAAAPAGPNPCGAVVVDAPAAPRAPGAQPAAPAVSPAGPARLAPRGPAGA